MLRLTLKYAEIQVFSIEKGLYVPETVRRGSKRELHTMSKSHKYQ